MAATIASVNMLGIVQRCAVVLIPDTLPVGVDHGQARAGVAVSVDYDRRIRGTLDLAQVQKFIVKIGTPLQEHPVSRLKVDFAQCGQAKSPHAPVVMQPLALGCKTAMKQHFLLKLSINLFPLYFLFNSEQNKRFLYNFAFRHFF